MLLSIGNNASDRVEKRPFIALASGLESL